MSVMGGKSLRAAALKSDMRLHGATFRLTLCGRSKARTVGGVDIGAAERLMLKSCWSQLKTGHSQFVFVWLKPPAPSARMRADARYLLGLL